jgi:mono/diheme cytochrome c family protein
MNNQNHESRGRIFGLLYVYIFLIGMVIGIIYITKIGDVAKEEVPPPLPDTTHVQTDLPLEMPSNVKSVYLSSLTTPTDSLIQKGKSIFVSTCVACHGSNGKGDGPAAASLNPKPRNFTSKEGWVNGPTLSGIFTTITQGISGSAMPPFSQFTPKERFALAHYIRQAFVPNPPKVTDDEIDNLNSKFNLSKGHISPGQIPVTDAMKLIEEETSDEYGKLINIQNSIDRQSGNEGAELFEKVTNDKLKALTVLSRSDDWKSNEKLFVSIVVDDVNENGFNREIFNLSNSQWDQLFGYLGNYF